MATRGGPAAVGDGEADGGVAVTETTVLEVGTVGRWAIAAKASPESSTLQASLVRC